MKNMICGIAILLVGPFVHANVILTGGDPNTYAVVYLSSGKDVYYKACPTADYPNPDCKNKPSLGIARKLFNSKLNEFGQKDQKLVSLQNEIKQLESVIARNTQNLNSLQNQIQSEKKLMESNQSAIRQLKKQIDVAKQRLASGTLTNTDRAEIQKFVSHAENQIIEEMKAFEASRLKAENLETQHAKLLKDTQDQQSNLAQRKGSLSTRSQEIKKVIADIGSSLDSGTPLVSFVNETAYSLVHSNFDLKSVPVSGCKVTDFKLEGGVARAAVKFELTTGVFPIYPRNAMDSRTFEIGSQNDLNVVYDKGSWIKTSTAYSMVNPLSEYAAAKDEKFIDCQLSQVQVPQDLKYKGNTANYLYAGRFNRKQIIAVCKAATGGRSADGYDGYIFGSSDSLGYRAADLLTLMERPPALMTYTQVDNLPPLAPGRYAWSYQPGCCGGGDGNYLFNFQKYEEGAKTRRPEWLDIHQLFGSQADTVELPTICSGHIFDRY